MDSTVIVALISSAGVVLAGLITLVGVRYTHRQARTAAEATARLERSKVDAEAYQRARETWTEHVRHLREQVAELRARVDELEDDRTRDRARLREWVDHARSLRRLLDEHEIAHPPAPAGV